VYTRTRRFNLLVPKRKKNFVFDFVPTTIAGFFAVIHLTFKDKPKNIRKKAEKTEKNSSRA